ncbi:MAG: precorrin-4 C(11)-methyltransferase [Oligoflexia bacterium]|nr:precorrin-4 C(11)-methyltransferase [Oligoflexia bacterium]
MKVYFIGAGPGDPELITLKGARLLRHSPVILYTGSLVPLSVVDHALGEQLLPQQQQGPQLKQRRILNSADMTLSEIVEVFLQAKKEDQDVARLHTGDPSIYGAISEQIQALRYHQIDWEIVPGVSSFVASAAALGVELTLPEVTQTIVITRMEGKTPVPTQERLRSLAQHCTTLAIFLSADLLQHVVTELLTVYPRDYPIALVHKASWPEQTVVQGNLGNILIKLESLASSTNRPTSRPTITSTTMILVGKVLDPLVLQNHPRSKLYAEDKGEYN